MKILELRFKNLNSLSGEWSIDFRTPEYLAEGIFAITGPTGAGKSTILDAICLALYGATPRLGRITKSGNEIMSRQTGECLAEVCFAAADGHFRCHWSQHRSRKRPDGNLVEARHEIADADNGKILESKKREVAAVVEDKTGMNFERFTRSILLAQGEFDTFLRADSDKRAPILEQITGSEIYSEISKKVHERQRQEQEKLKVLQAETSGITVLTESQESEISRELGEKERAGDVLAAQLKKVEKAIFWHKEIARLHQELETLAREEEELGIMTKDFQPDRERLALARKAAELEGAYATLTTTRKQQKDDLQSRRNEENRLPEIIQTVKQQEERLKDLEQQIIRAKKELSKQTPLIQKTRALDQQLGDRKTTITQKELEIEKISAQISDNRQSDEKTRDQIEQLQKEIDQLNDNLDKQAGNEFLLTEFAGLKEQINNLLTLRQEISSLKKSYTETEKLLQAADATLIDRNNQVNTAKRKLEKARQKLLNRKNRLIALLGERLLREYRTEKETRLREMAFRREIADLETYRKQLADGRPCPLCGACEHPFARGNVPEIEESEKEVERLTILISQAEQLELEIRELESAEKKITSEIGEAARLETKAAANQDNATRDLRRIDGEIKRHQTHFANLKDELLISLRPLEITKISDPELPKLNGLLKARLEQRQEQHLKKVKLEKELSKLNSEREKNEAVLTTQNHLLSEMKQKLERYKDEYQALTAERHKLFGNRQPDTEQARLEENVAAAEKAEKNLAKSCADDREKLQAIRVRINELNKRTANRSAELQILEANFNKALNTAGFTDEQLFNSCQLPPEKRNQLAAKAEQLDTRITNLKARKQDREKRLTEETEKRVTKTPEIELVEQQSKLSETLKQSREFIAELRHKLAENRLAKERIKEKRALIEQQVRECRRWDNLHQLIGSADGKKYRNFAQGLTFEMMVFNANQQLDKMSDRYLLVRDKDRPLELNVVDKYQAGEIRSTKNLSGGESFIVSLALALGLSRMASRKVRVDSLFLDEGFGTLDETALETALETLANLQQSNKLIGIISHVPALKERISTRIKVTPIRGGRSTISGPGCRRID